MEPYRGTVAQVSARDPTEDQAPEPAFPGGQCRDRNRIRGDADFCRGAAAPGELARGMVGDGHLGSSPGLCWIPVLDSAGYMASGNAIHSCLPGTLASQGASATSF